MMTVFTFDNNQEFGLFFKINSARLLGLSTDEGYQGKINEYTKVFSHTKGGCGCNLNKRRKAAAVYYESFIPEFFTHPMEAREGDESAALLRDRVRATVKEILGNPSSVCFKKDTADQEPFFSI
jgi:hypothetical protein